MKLVKPVGSRGSWFAKIGGENLPCVHHHWRRGNYYLDPGLIIGNKKHEAFVEGIRLSKKVIMTDDELLELLERGASFKRKSYISLWTADFIEFDEAGLRFLFTNKIGEF